MNGPVMVMCRRAVVHGMVMLLLASLMVAVPFVARPKPARAVEPPPGGVVDSVAETGWTKGSFSVSEDGAAQYSLPLWVSPGRGSVEPDLSLSFDSRARNGLVGVGWSLTGLSSIAPCAKTWAQDGFTDGVGFASTDALCLGGNRLMPVGPVTGDTREYRTEQESFAKVVAHGMADGVPNFFKVFAKDRTISTFGETTNSRLEAFQLVSGSQPNTLVRASTTTRVTVAWSVNKVEDRNGNEATIEYEESEGSDTTLWQVQSRPKSIKYPPNREVRFTYEPRPDHIEAYANGAHTIETKRLSRVEMFGGPQGATAERLRVYKLDYHREDHSITRRSLLSQITDCDGKETCMLPLPLEWTTGSNEFEVFDTNVRDAGQPLSAGIPNTDPDHRIITLDVNGDGCHDILYPRTDLVLRIGDHQDWRFRLSDCRGGFGAATVAGFTPPTFENPDPNTRNDNTDPNGQVRPVDVNLDGRTDLMVWETQPDGTNKWGLYLSNGSTFRRTTTDLQPVADVNEVNEANPVYFADLNGDGRSDFITAVFDSPNDQPPNEAIDGPWHYRLNIANPGPGAQWGPLVDSGTFLAPIHNKGKVIDADGDGRADLVGYRLDRLAVGWGLDSSDQVGERRFAFSPVGATEDGVLESVSADINGDGLPDAVSPYTMFRRSGLNVHGQLRGSLNAGTGVGPFSATPQNFWEPRTFCSALPDPGTRELPPCDTSKDRGVRYVDFNGDGADDVLSFQGGEPDETDALGTRMYTWRNGTFVRDPLRLGAGFHGPQGFNASQVLDIDADGMLDIVHPHGDPFNPDDSHLRILRRMGGKPDQLIGVGDRAVGERIEVDYTTLADRRDVRGTPLHVPCDEASYPRVCLRSGESIVRAHTLDNGRPEVIRHELDLYLHSYKGARMDLQGRGWLGFTEHRVVRHLTEATTVTEFDNRTLDTRGTSVYPFANRPKKVTYTVDNEPTASAREFRRTTTHAPDLHRTASGSWFVGPGTVTDLEEERAAGAPTWATLRQSTTTTTLDEFGNPDLTVSATTGGRTTTDDMTHENDTTNWLIGKAKHQELKSCTAVNECKTRNTDFDQYPNGDHKLTVVEPDDPERKLTLTTTTVYREFGAVESITTHGHQLDDTPDEVRRESLFEYDADMLHPTAAVNAMDHRTQITTHSGLGVPTQVITPNVNEKATMLYDRFGRLVQTNGSDGSVQTTTYSFDRANSQQNVLTEGNDGSRTRVLLDRLGREVEQRTRAFDGQGASVFTGYDLLGHVEKVSRPMLPGETARFTTTRHDQRDRVTSVTAPDGESVQHSYLERTTTTTDAKGFTSTTVTSVDGDVSLRSEGSGLVETTFEYGPFDEVKKIVAPDQTVQDMQYDVLGQRTLLNNPSSGPTTTTYTAFGEVDTETNAEEEVTDSDYDALGRMVRTISEDGVAVNKWDTAPNGIGRLVNAKSADGVGGVGIDYRYTPQGKPQSTQWSVGGNVFKVDYDYDTIGRQSTMTYPAVLGTTSRLRVSNVYNQHGYLSQVKDSTGLTGAAITAPCTDTERAAGRCLWTANSREADGQLKQETYGNGTVTTNIYKPLTGQLDQRTTMGPGTIGKLADLDYEYDPNRNVRQRNDLVSNRHERFEHDQLNRLAIWKILAQPNDVSVLTAAYTYDELGNLTSEAFTGAPHRNVSYAYGEEVNGVPMPPHALTTRNGVHYTYDQAGRQTTGDGRGITYTAMNLPKTITWGQQGEKQTAFAYDSNGARVRKSDSDQTQISIPGLLERHTPAGTDSTQVHNLHHVTVEGRVVAQVNKIQDSAQPAGPITLSQTTYLHQDLQGSTHLITDPAGREAGNEGGFIRDLNYDPWGQRLDTSNVPLGRQRRAHRTGYTGHKHDDELGLIDMLGRVQDPAARRFITPDPFIQDPLSSQSLNRYAYVWNNPTTLTDPTGFLAAEDLEPANVSWDQPGGNNDSSAAISTGTRTKLVPVPKETAEAPNPKGAAPAADSDTGTRKPEGTQGDTNKASDRKDTDARAGSGAKSQAKGRASSSMTVAALGRSATGHDRGDALEGSHGAAPSTADMSSRNNRLNAAAFAPTAGIAASPAAAARVAVPLGKIARAVARAGGKITAAIFGANLSLTPSLLFAAEVAGITALANATLMHLGRFGIQPYLRMVQLLRNTGLQAHHLIEQRFASALGQDPRRMLSIAVTVAEHAVFTQAWRTAIPLGWGTRYALQNPQAILNAARHIYASHPTILKALGL